ncbi:MAG: hypothetical protein N4A33_07830 [Bacteriovoracaceae bacterium]|jgi:hypothetical protein|nr:hypothetical protein [Bacteriovoracaceae bacterium]
MKKLVVLGLVLISFATSAKTVICVAKDAEQMDDVAYAIVLCKVGVRV